MGGHENGHAQSIKVPSPDIYKVENVPELLRVQKILAAKGLKDPWLRNEVWRYEYPTQEMYVRKVLLPSLFRGARLGIPAFLITIGIQSYLGNGNDHDHHADHH